MMIEFTQTPVPMRPHRLPPAAEAQVVIAVNTVADIVAARQQGRRLSLASGCGSAEATVVATISSELARNVVQYAKSGEIVLEKLRVARKHGIRILCRDAGPGIMHVQRALMGGYSTSGGLGMGLSGVRRLVDEFHLDSGSTGTTVTLTKWLCEPAPLQSLMTSPSPRGIPQVALRVSTTNRAPATTSW